MEDFQHLKNNISDACLQYYSPSKPVILQVDASKRGLGVVLKHRNSEGEEKPAAYTSKSLTLAETRYANID